MRVFAVSGVHHSGKTTTIEHLISELARRGYTVGTIKSVGTQEFSIDQAGTNTDRHRAAGAAVVTAVSDAQTAVMYRGRLAYADILRFYDTDWVIIEGAHREPYPRIVCAAAEHHIEQRLDERTFLICGAVAETLDLWQGVPVIDATSRAKEVVDLLEQNVPKSDHEDRGAGVSRVSNPCAPQPDLDGRFEAAVYVDGEEILMVPFVQDFVSRTVLGMLSSLKGYRCGSEFKVEIRRL